MLPAKVAIRAGLVACLLLAGSARAGLVERSVEVPIRLTWTAHPETWHRMTVAITYDDRATRQPFALLLHGRPVDPQQFRRMGIQTYPANARWLAQQGFVVLVPTRIGYGQTGGPDVEFAGPCRAKDYRLSVAALREETRQLLTYWQDPAGRDHLPPIDPDHGMVLGESFGALGALAVADGSVRGVDAVVNVAGGDGGDFTQPDRPCAPEAVAELMQVLGHQARRRSLWLYSQNDHLWGAQWPARWFARYTSAGGPARFAALPPAPGNGHFVFNRRPLFWQALVQGFLQEQGLLPVR